MKNRMAGGMLDYVSRSRRHTIRGQSRQEGRTETDKIYADDSKMAENFALLNMEE